MHHDRNNQQHAQECMYMGVCVSRQVGADKEHGTDDIGCKSYLRRGLLHGFLLPLY